MKSKFPIACQTAIPFCFGLLALTSATGSAAVLAQYGFNDSLAASPLAGVTATAVTETGFTAVYSGSSSEGTKSRALTYNKLDDSFGTDHFYEFTLTPSMVGQSLDLTNLTFFANIGVSNPTDLESSYQLRYSTTPTGMTPVFLTVGGISQVTSTAFTQFTYDLSGAAFDNISNITFRLDVRKDNTSTASNISVRLDNLVVNGSVPEPSSAMMILGGVALAALRRRR